MERGFIQSVSEEISIFLHLFYLITRLSELQAGKRRNIEDSSDSTENQNSKSKREEIPKRVARRSAGQCNVFLFL
jgi:hypothetical protein